jgi:hypothetical protein
MIFATDHCLFWRLQNQETQPSQPTSFAVAKLTIATVASYHVAVAELSIAIVGAFSTN